jgi:hypothetical protein
VAVVAELAEDVAVAVGSTPAGVLPVSAVVGVATLAPPGPGEAAGRQQPGDQRRSEPARDSSCEHDAARQPPRHDVVTKSCKGRGLLCHPVPLLTVSPSVTSRC